MAPILTKEIINILNNKVHNTVTDATKKPVQIEFKPCGKYSSACRRFCRNIVVSELHIAQMRCLAEPERERRPFYEANMHMWLLR